MAINWLIQAAARPRQICFFIGPTRKQAQETAWRMLQEQIPAELVQRVRQSDLETELINGSMIRLHGLEFLRGSGLDAVVLDEYAFAQPELWVEVVLPMLIDRRGRALISSTPFGLNHFYDLFVDAQTRSEWTTFHFPTRAGGFVSETELELLRSNMDARSFAQEIDARFEPHEGRVYYAFSRELNVTEVTKTAEPKILVGLDFNVDPMTAIVCQKVGNKCHVFDEVVLRNSNTPEMMEELCRRYPERGLVHPDPSGAARKTSAQAGVTDHTIIQQFGWDVYPMKPYPVVNRVNAVNAMLRNANGHARLLIDPKCKHLLRSLEGLTYEPGTPIADKSTGLDHAADALGYLVGAVFPVVNPNGFSITNAFTGKSLLD